MGTATKTDGVAGRARPPAFWWRMFLVAIVLVTGTFAVRHSLGLALANRSPEAALNIDRENAIVRARAAFDMVDGETDRTRFGEARALALGALQRDAGNVTALAVMGLTSDRTAASDAAFSAAERLSRRDLSTQLWMIESAVADNDIAGALRHYDTAMRTSRAAPSILFPVLIGAASDEALRVEIANTLARRPSWGGLYIQQLAQSGDVRAAASLLMRLKRQGVPTGAAADAALYSRLIEARLFDVAWAVYATDTPEAARAGVRNPRFSEQPVSPTPFDWQTTDTEFVSAQIEPGAGGQGRLSFSTASGEGGEAARQMLALPSGPYRLQSRVATLQGADEAPPYLRVTCLPAGNELSRVPLAARAPSSATFTVPAGCAGQSLALIIQPGSGLATVEGAIDQISVAPSR
ncbi:hypothetical protein [Sphingomonas sp. AX6]|uniref:hypothetical protein n=1 Tax=Sphingomonas sp. AX6 TaxID=2653171 RepID=UPI0013582F07|nr:hypothetical protein [Sphingomonas sp. AX6]